jgi:hypothetical protein
MEIEVTQQFFIKFSSIKFLENISAASQSFSCAQTDGLIE